MKQFRSFGYFGKGVILPPPAAPAAPSTTNSQTVPVTVATGVEETTTLKPSSGQDEVAAKLAQLREAIEAKRMAKEAELQNVREQHWRQATYGRDTVQDRPDRAGYATESEKLMGGRTGYYQKVETPAPAPAPAPALQGFGASEELNKATQELNFAAQGVKRLTADVKAGTATKSDLAKAVEDLKQKSIRVKELSGFNQVEPSWHSYLSENRTLVLVVIGLLVLPPLWRKIRSN